MTRETLMIQIFPTRAGTAALFAVLAFGCGSDGPNGPAIPVLASAEVTPVAVVLYNSPPGDAVTLSVVGRNAGGTTIVSGIARSFSTSNPAVATVGADGIVRAVTLGTANILSSVTVGDVTRTATTAVTVNAPASTALVVAPQFTYEPGVVHLAMGGSVTWTIGSIHHDVRFSAAGAPPHVPELRDSSASRIFNTRGSFDYSCTFHSGMSGTVHVH
jgi:plastocyanin